MKLTRQQETDISEENLQLREAVKRGTMELEHKNRELEIEASLERVRSNAMAMRSSDELNTIIGKVFTECIKLDIQLDRGIIMIFNPESLDSWWWMANPEAPDLPKNYHVPYNAYEPYLAYLNGWKNQTVRWTYVLEGKEKKDWDAHIFVNSELSLLPIEVKQVMMGFTKVYLNASFNSFGGLTLASLNPMSDEHFVILLRFAKVFDLTYTRFNDLKQAEAQVREATIEAALDRVRVRTMAMQKSDELADAAQLLFQQFHTLKIATFVCGYIFIQEERNIQQGWTVLPDGTLMPDFIDFPLTGDRVLNERYMAWKAKVPLHKDTVEGEENKKHHQFLAAQVPANVATGIFDHVPSRITFYSANFSQGYLHILATEPITEEEEATVIRFAKVFDQTYTRFLDLQKAEAQTRESQIQLALERVRARTMAMQKSDELSEVAVLLFKQVSELEIKTWTTGFNVWSEDGNSYTDYISSPKGNMIKSYTIDTTKFHAFRDVRDAKNRGDEFWVQYLEGENLKETYRELSKFGDEKQYEKMLEDGFEFPSSQYDHFVFGSQVSLMFITYTPIPEAHDIFIRFGRVFQQTYTRFLDLQKSEALAKETIKASSLDRVRAEIASMRTVEDLQQINPIIWQELNALGVPFVRCGIFIINESYAHVQAYLSSSDGHSLATLDLPFNSNELTLNIVNHWRKGFLFNTRWNKEEFINWMQTMIREGQVQNRETYQGASQPPESLDLHFIPFKQGMLYVGNISTLGPEELQLVKSLAESFSIAYARYEDFRQLEEAKNQIEKTLTELKSTQSQLIQSEKMASLGELTAGIAHEIQNPLNFVNNFSEVNTELIEEMKQELEKGNMEEVKSIAEDIAVNEKKIAQHGKRADSIVKGMLLHSRKSSGIKESTDINALADEYLRLTYHGLKAKDKSFNATMKSDLDHTIGKINVTPQEMGRVLLNLLNNAFYAVNEKRKLNMDGYEPTVTVSTQKLADKVEIKVSDNGNGIPQLLLDKIFQPFFTTKPSGEGTGLGLSLSYDIVTKGHGGELTVDTKEGEYTTFRINLPV